MSLFELILATKEGKPLAPVTIVVPSHLAGLQLRRSAASVARDGPGFLNVKFRTLGALAEFLAAPALAARRKRPLSDIALLMSVELALEAQPSMARIADHPASVTKVARLLKDVRNAGADGALPGLLDSVKTRSLELTKSYYDERDVFEAATEAIADGGLPGSLGRLLICPQRPSLPVHEQKFLEVLEASGRTGQVEDKPLTPNSECWIMPDAEQECREASRKIAEYAASGIPLHMIAVLFPSRELYGALAHETIRRAGIPCNSRLDRQLSQIEGGRLLTGFFSSVEGSYRRADVIEWVCSTDIVHEDRFVPAHQWDRLSKKARVTKGLDSWRTRMKQVIASGEKATLDDPGGEFTRARAKDARGILGFLDNVESQAEAFKSLTSWSGFALWAAGLFKLWLPGKARGTTEFELLREALDALKELDAFQGQPSPKDFRKAAALLLEHPTGAREPFGTGVFLGTIKEAFGLRFDAVIVLGMTSDGLPSAPSRFLLTRDQAEQLGLETAEAAVKIEREYFEKVKLSCLNISFSFPRADLRRMRESVPSHWFLEEVASITGEEYVGFDELDSLDHSRVLHSHSFDAVLKSGRVGCPQEFRMLSLAGKHGDRLSNETVAQFSEAEKLATGRLGPALSPWDGEVHLAETPRLSATSLEDFGTCPMRFFLRQVLKLKLDREISDSWTVDAMEKGSAVHRAFKKFFEEGPPGGVGESWDETDHTRMQAYLDEELSNLERDGFVRDSPQWKFDKEVLKEKVSIFLDRDSEERRKTGRPIAFEFGFGLDGEPLEVDIQGVELSLRGSIDRVDFNEETGIATVIDYKTGSGRKYDGQGPRNPLLSGQLYQLPLYGEVVKREWSSLGLNTSPKVQAEYVFIEPKKEKEAIRLLDLDAVQAQFESNLSVLKSLCDNGLFPSVPGGFQNNVSKSCKYCDFTELCPAAREDLWKRKSEDPRLADFAAMAANQEEAGDE